jgi:hypothetical protein
VKGRDDGDAAPEMWGVESRRIAGRVQASLEGYEEPQSMHSLCLDSLFPFSTNSPC